MSFGASDPDLSRAACSALYRRHRAYIFGVCWNAHGEDFGREGVKELTQEVFIRAMERAATFRPVAGLTLDDSRRHVRGWLGTIAHRLAQDWLRDGGHEPASDDGLEVVARADSDVDAPLSAEAERVKEGWAILSKVEEEVVRMTMQHYDPALKHQRLPSGVAKDLAARFGVEPESITQIRKRAYDKMRKFVQGAIAIPFARKIKA